MLAHQGQLQRPLDAGRSSLLGQGSAGPRQQQQGVAGLALVEQPIDQLDQGLCPLGQRPRPLQALGEAGEALDEGGQAAEQLGAGAFQGVQRPAVAEQGRGLAGQLRRRGEAQEQAIQALAPGEGGIGRQAELGAVAGVAAPAHPGLAQPVAQQAQVLGLDAGAAGQSRLLQPAQQLFGAEAAVGQGEQVEEGLDQRQLRAQAAVGQAEGNSRDTLTRSEHRLDIGRVALHVRGQHHHLVRSQRRVGGEAGEQLVMEDFHLAQRRVGDMYLQRAVVLA